MNTLQTYDQIRSEQSSIEPKGAQNPSTAQNTFQTGQTHPQAVPLIPYRVDQLSLPLSVIGSSGQQSEVETLYWTLDKVRSETLNDLVEGNHDCEQVAQLHDRVIACSELQNSLFGALLQHTVNLSSKAYGEGATND